MNSVPNEAVGTSRGASPYMPVTVKPLERQAAVELFRPLAVEPFGDAVVGLRRVERRKVEPTDAVAVLVGARERQVHTVAQAVSRAAPRTSCVPSVPASSVTEPPPSDAPVRVMTLTTAKNALSP